MKEKCTKCHEGEEVHDTGLCQDCNDMKGLKTFFYVSTFVMSAMFVYGALFVLLLSKSS